MAEVMTLNLGKVRGASRKNKAKKAVNEVRRQVSQRYPDTEVRVSNSLNEQIWSRGAGKPPKSLDVQLVEMDDHLLVETADVDLSAAVEESEETVEEEETEAEASEPEEDEAEDEEPKGAAADVPEDVADVLRDGTIAEGKEAVQELNKADFEALLDFEEKHQNRKGMKTFLRSNMR